jgi:SAM-dependent methyltransferase
MQQIGRKEKKLEDSSKFKDYFAHLSEISWKGRLYKNLISSPVLFLCARKFGRSIVEIGSGTGSGILGRFPKKVRGLEINPMSVSYCRSIGLSAELIRENEAFPIATGSVSCCVLDNVLEHIAHPQGTLDECYRITQAGGGLVIAVPGIRGFESDHDHKIFYDAQALRSLDERWVMQSIFSLPLLFQSDKLSRSVKQYCLVATYKKA